MKSPTKIAPLLLATLILLSSIPLFGNSAKTKTSEETVESLYPKAFESMVSGEYKIASALFERMFNLDGGIKKLLKENEGEYMDLVFDYGTCLIHQQRWEEARNCFQYCVDAPDYSGKWK